MRTNQQTMRLARVSIEHIRDDTLVLQTGSTANSFWVPGDVFIRNMVSERPAHPTILCTAHWLSKSRSTSCSGHSSNGSSGGGGGGSRS